ncbi:hypothetical protein DY000_02033073 [Brassica cretica]|uniref:Uncharacterized protein n=1 Tax=Brassica cretica TaxID=69181 RepID=A0ABQ7DI61_BRACR|nr:hypothetical protein DY000_02033073 [Brassica cretica]
MLPSRTLVSRHPHEEVPTPAPTTKLCLRPLLLSLTPDVESSKAWHLGFHPYHHPLSLIVASCRSSMQHGNSIVANFRATECEIPTGTGSGLT